MLRILRPGSGTRLICFPNAGAGASIFRRWLPLVPGEMELCSVQLPGREDRWSEPCILTLHEAAAMVATELLEVSSRRTVLFGHSMGAILAYEVACAIEMRSDGLSMLVVSGHDAPHVPPPSQRCRHDAPEEVFIADLRRLDGTPPELLADPSFRITYLKTLRGDYAMLDRYRWSPRQALLVPILVYSGNMDREVSKEGLGAWDRLTSNVSAVCWFPGGHFYLFEQHWQQVIRTLVADMDRLGNAHARCVGRLTADSAGTARRGRASEGPPRP
ncbi:thioesterase [Verminephrobacter aporrectodeae subsp. tuberculatae]|uniref:thioesterase II family protein n=1 Tax=Verminephrobacter aporrectodeae TaxID=1110389 RepID=UPI0002378581|nr:thioesterase [Verminephrobacter aporrectodeae subsp. tuberculatae]MCW8169831.1 thioesterase [Verminephrobacter aporrectodeae subsp. tuberculatae]MCW8208691.1 thioesterase [Verminephrobacter aporrectodeae subsp. tuberculatae]